MGQISPIDVTSRMPILVFGAAKLSPFAVPDQGQSIYSDSTIGTIHVQILLICP